jgi:hypothetical protein
LLPPLALALALAPPLALTYEVPTSLSRARRVANAVVLLPLLAPELLVSKCGSAERSPLTPPLHSSGGDWCVNRAVVCPTVSEVDTAGAGEELEPSGDDGSASTACG